MILPGFDVLIPETIEEACAMLAEHAEEGVRVLAGGTDILVDLRRPIIPHHVPRCDGCPTHPEGKVLSTIECNPVDSGRLMASEGSIRAALTDPRKSSPAYLVSLHKLKNLKSIEQLADGSLKIGALTTISQIERSSEIRNNWTALADGADSLGSPLVRNRGTIGGNIANARPAADTAIPTIALGGTITLQGPSGTRTIPSEDFATGPGLSVIANDEVLTEINFPPHKSYSGSAYYKLANRKALEISLVGVAVWLVLDKTKQVVRDVRVALGAVGPMPILSKSVGNVLINKIPDEDTLIDASKAVAGDARPIDDHRGSAWYRVQMVEEIALRLLKATLERARKDT